MEINNHHQNYDEGGSQYNGSDEYNKDLMNFFLLFLLFISFCSVFTCFNNNDNRITIENINTGNNERLIKKNKKIITLNETNNKDCVICFEEYKEGDIIIELECKHVYHDPCISKWLQKDLSCPMCRTQLN